MVRSEVVTLIKSEYTVDAIQQRIKTETPRDVFGEVTSVTGSEWFEGSRAGMNPSLRVVVFRYDYDGEEMASVNGQRYSIYRTFARKDEMIELYLEKRKGTA